MNAQELRAVQMQAPKPKTKGMTPLKFAGICTLSFSGSLALILMAAHGAFKSTPAAEPQAIALSPVSISPLDLNAQFRRTVTPVYGPPVVTTVHTDYVRPPNYVAFGETYSEKSPIDGIYRDGQASPRPGMIIVNERRGWICNLPSDVAQAYALAGAGQTDAEVEASVDCAILETGEYSIVMDTIGKSYLDEVLKVKLNGDHKGTVGWVMLRQGWATKKCC